MRVTLPVLAALVVLAVLAPGAQAATLTDPGPGSIAPTQLAQWNGWVQRSLVPTVAGRVLVAPVNCPEAAGVNAAMGLPVGNAVACSRVAFPRIERVTCTGGAGCVTESVQEPSSFCRSAGCVADTRGTIYLPPGAPHWMLFHELGHFYFDLSMDDAERSEFDHLLRFPHAAYSLDEYFAAGYSLCARKASLKPGHGEVREYGYRVGPVTHQRVCNLIRRAALN